MAGSFAKLVCLISFLVSTTAFAVDNSSNAALFKKKINYKGLKVSQALKVVRISDGKVLYSQNPKSLMVPASVTKLITSAAVLDHFSPSHRFNTGFYYTGTKKQGVISGDLIIKGDGDPFFVSEKLWQVAADFKHLGIKKVSGNLVIDNSLFGDLSRDQMRKSGKRGSSNAYDAPISAFGVNFNTVTVAVSPGEGNGRPALVNLDPYSIRGFSIKNNARTARLATKAKVNVNRKTAKDGTSSLFASGAIATNAGLKKIYRSVGNHVSDSGEQVRSFLNAFGVDVKGRVKEGSLPESATKIFDVPSYDLSRIIKGLNRYSNNYIADVMLKRLGAALPKQGEPNTIGQGTYDNGLFAIEKFLRSKVGIKSRFVIKNGSGLTNENRISVDQLCKLLSYSAGQMKIFPEFLASLPAAGWNGTLKKRFSKNGLDRIKGKVRAKTGTLTNPISVSTLAGYIQHPKHGLLAFAVMHNGINGSKQPGILDLRQHQDYILLNINKYL